ncbi:MAG TPA: hypothetical protein GXZ53_09600 [Firmicutes bacterium]|jgi:hypothetical protein|nr:hypothetical protein [Bacillota bacterium]
MRALFTLTPAEAKRLIAKAVVKLPQVQEAYKNGRLAVVGSTTNAFVVEELLGIKLKKENYTAGVITDGRPCVSDLPQMIKPYLFEHGKRVDTTIGEFVKQFTARDVLIKGANAVDPEGNAGILVGSREAGTIGAVWPLLTAVGAALIMPAGLEKLVPYIPTGIGIDHFTPEEGGISLGMPAGLFPVIGAQVITEIEAMAILGGVEAVLIAAGGTGGSEGSTTFMIEGPEENVNKMMQLVKAVKGEPPVGSSRRACDDCDKPCAYQ